MYKTSFSSFLIPLKVVPEYVRRYYNIPDRQELCVFGGKSRHRVDHRLGISTVDELSWRTSLFVNKSDVKLQTAAF